MAQVKMLCRWSWFHWERTLAMIGVTGLIYALGALFCNNLIGVIALLVSATILGVCVVEETKEFFGPYSSKEWEIAKIRRKNLRG
ncbi:hypothetical protein LCGC14_1736980 [marine sediment metagenome]|uniref:Uncharacterized protein n=1 Tax=marine sediment metagenome TaxID=412755 RepID=A0A0F9H7R2_9ZZZZ